MDWWRSLIKRRKISGPKILPWGTPERTRRVREGLINRNGLIEGSEVSFEPQPQVTSDSNIPQLQQELIVRNAIESFLKVKINYICLGFYFKGV